MFQKEMERSIYINRDFWLEVDTNSEVFSGFVKMLFRIPIAKPQAAARCARACNPWTYATPGLPRSAVLLRRRRAGVRGQLSRPSLRRLRLEMELQPPQCLRRFRIDLTA